MITRKYYKQIFCWDVEVYIKGCDVCQFLKTVCYKPYGDLWSLSMPTHHWKNFFIEFVISLPILTNGKSDRYHIIFDIIDHLRKMVYYKPVKSTIDVADLAKVIMDMVVRYYILPGSTIDDENSLLISKFWSLLYYFLDIKQRFSIVFSL